MYVVAGVVLEKIYAKKWETFVQKNIFDPLSMKRSNFSIEASKKDYNFAFPYEKEGQGFADAFFVNLSGVAPTGTINSTVNDMLKWVSFNLNPGKFKKIISDETLEKIHEPQMLMDGEILKDMPELSYSSYGFGWFVSNYRGHHWLRHSGEINGFTSEIAMLPLDNIGIVLLANLDEGLALLKGLEFSLFDRLVAKLSENKVDWDGRLRKYVGKQEEAERLEEKKVEKEVLFDQSKFKFGGKFLHKAYGIIEFKDDLKVLKGRLNDVSFNIIFRKYSDEGLIFKTKNGMRYGKEFEGGNNLELLLKMKKDALDQVVLLSTYEGGIGVVFRKAL